MNVFIARDGSIIGEYPHHELEARARAGELRPDDYYWHEGMDENWLLLENFLRPQAWETQGSEPTPPAPSWPTLNRRIIFGGAAALFVAVALVAFLIIKPRGPEEQQSTALVSLPNAATELEVRDKAAADLRERIEHLPSTAKPPLNAFYYDLRVNMKQTVVRRVPWIATLHGFENAIDPATNTTISRTEFILTVAYEDGAWVFRDYEASVTDLAKGIITEIRKTENAPTPPSISAAMGLKRRDLPITVPPIISIAPTRSTVSSPEPWFPPLTEP